MTSNDIINRALTYVNNTKWCYWYGGKGQQCTQSLLNLLSKLYPNIYTKSYISKCKQDITAGRSCIDCSGLVCSVYNKPMIGTSQFDRVFQRWSGKPLDGMIVWRANHCGIYYRGKIIEARGVDRDITYDRIYQQKSWSRIYYSNLVEYNNNNSTNKKSTDDLIKIAKRVISGEFGNGEERKSKLSSLGYNPTEVQKIVNSLLS